MHVKNDNGKNTTSTSESVVRIDAFFDAEASLWGALSEHVFGVNTEALTFEELRSQVKKQTIKMLWPDGALTNQKSAEIEIIVRDRICYGEKAEINAPKKHKYTLAELLDATDPNTLSANRDAEWDNMPDVGRERNW